VKRNQIAFPKARRRDNFAFVRKGMRTSAWHGPMLAHAGTGNAPDLLGAVRVSGESTMQMQMPPCVLITVR